MNLVEIEAVERNLIQLGLRRLRLSFFGFVPAVGDPANTDPRRASGCALFGRAHPQVVHVLSSCFDGAGCSYVNGGFGSSFALHLAHDVEAHNNTNVDEADHHHSLGAELQALRVLAEEGELVALSVSAALTL